MIHLEHHLQTRVSLIVTDLDVHFTSDQKQCEYRQILNVFCLYINISIHIIREFC